MSSPSINVDMQQFDTQGYLVARSLLDPETDLLHIKEEYSALLDSLADAWFKEGKIASTYQDLPLRSACVSSPHKDRTASRRHYSPLCLYCRHPHPLGAGRVQSSAESRILDVMKNLIGGEIYSNPAQHIRIRVREASFLKNS